MHYMEAKAITLDTFVISLLFLTKIFVPLVGIFRNRCGLDSHKLFPSIATRTLEKPLIQLESNYL